MAVSEGMGVDPGMLAGIIGLMVLMVGLGGVMTASRGGRGAVAALRPAVATTPIKALGVPPVPPAGPPAAAPAPPPVPSPPPALPHGKGMWLHYLRQAAGGDPAAIVAQAKATGLTHLYLRLGSSKDGFYAQGDLDRLLPVAHAAHLAVVGWDFPYLFDAEADAVRAKAEIDYTTPTGQRIDAFSADIETRTEGVNISVPVADTYSRRLRELAGPGYPLIATVPRPRYNRGYPYAEIVRQFDAVVPMVYWLARDPAAEVDQAVTDLAGLGKPIMPVGQAYDAASEGGPPGPPPREQLDRFIQTAESRGVSGFSFWVWHTATPDQWAAIKDARG
ncbi:MAG TPA: hypothetical protein VHL53_23035 [Acidimicrobiia bacterium]|nr:hypothetical protein [Acidimicrobiia bacterium]